MSGFLGPLGVAGEMAYKKMKKEEKFADEEKSGGAIFGYIVASIISIVAVLNSIMCSRANNVNMFMTIINALVAMMFGTIYLLWSVLFVKDNCSIKAFIPNVKNLINEIKK